MVRRCERVNHGGVGDDVRSIHSCEFDMAAQELIFAAKIEVVALHAKDAILNFDQECAKGFLVQIAGENIE